MAFAAKASDLICWRCSFALGSSAGGLIASRYAAAVKRAPAAVLGTGTPSSSYVMKELPKLRVSAALSSGERCDNLDLGLVSARPVELRESCLLRALDKLACFLRSSSVALTCRSRSDSCQLKYWKVNISSCVASAGIIVHSLMTLSAFAAISAVIVRVVTPSGIVTVHGNSVGLRLAATSDDSAAMAT